MLFDFNVYIQLFKNNDRVQVISVIAKYSTDFLLILVRFIHKTPP